MDNQKNVNELLDVDSDSLLKDYGLLNSNLSEPFLLQSLLLATKICKTQNAYISVLGSDYQYIISQIGKKLNVIKREHSICQHTVINSSVLVIPNTLKDKRTSNLKITHEENPVRFYAGYPLIDDDENRLGAFCVTDSEEKFLNNEQKETLEILGKQVIEFLKQRKSLIQIINKENKSGHTQGNSNNLVNEIEVINRQLKEDKNSILVEKEKEENWRKELLYITNIFPGTIAKLNKQYQYVFNNDKFVQWSGLTREELYLKHVSELFGKEAFQQLVPTFDKVFSGGTARFESLIEMNNQKKYLRITIMPSRKGGVIDGAFVFSEDISEIKSYQSQLENSNENLLNFAHIVSHDIKAPLRSIVNFSQLLKRDLEKRDIDYEAEFLDFVISAGKQLNQLTTDLLNFAKIDHKDTDKETVRIGTVIDAVQLNLHELIRKEDARIYSTINDESVVGFPSDFILLFQNFISNAIKYRRKEVNPVVEISAKSFESNIEFTIKDNGSGIKPHQIDEIFIPFKRLVSRPQDIEGSGIGLSTCQKIMEKYDSEITVTSEVGKGSEFTFSLPTGIPFHKDLS